MQYINKSIWSEELDSILKNKLNKNLNLDVLIIGGGLTGLSTAYHLINSNLKIAVVEKNTIGSGVTSKTTGKLTYLQDNIYSKIKTFNNEDISKKYFESQQYAMNLVKDIIEKEKIDCNLEKVRSYVVTNSKNKTLEKEMNLLKKFGIPIKQTNELPTKEKVTNSYFVENTYVFHPIKYVKTLKKIVEKKDILVYEDTKIISIDKKDSYFICKTDDYEIKTKYVVLAMHYPYFLIPFWISLKTCIEKSYLEAYKVDKNYHFSAINIDKPTVSLRYHENEKEIYKLYLTNSHVSCFKNNEKENFNTLIESKDKKPEFVWSNKDIITNDSLPFIGSINDDNTLLIGTGYNTWGMTNASLAGKIISDIILKKENDYIYLFNPKRKLNIGKLLNFPLILGSNTISFLSTKLNKNKSWYSKNVRFEKINGKNVGIYTDENNKEHIVYNLCPHLKCSLIFNEIEKTWDCPCHGSRFDVDGNSIEGPSNYNISFKG